MERSQAREKLGTSRRYLKRAKNGPLQLQACESHIDNVQGYGVILRQKILNHLESNKLLSENQHGFMAGRFCTTQLLEVLDIWSRILEDGENIDVIYLDFAKVFDTVPHR